MKTLKLAILAFLLTTATAFACSGSMCKKDGSGSAKGMMCKKECSHKMKGGMCDTKGCSHKMKGAMCTKGCSHKMKAGMCDSKGCSHKMNGAMCKKGCSHKMKGSTCNSKECSHKMKGLEGMRSQMGNKMCMTRKSHFLKNLHYTLKNLKLSKSDWSDVKLAINNYKMDMKKLDKGTPLKSVQNGKFDRKIFLNSHPLQKKLAFQADLLETVFLVLNKEQKSRFAMLMGASQYYCKLHPQGKKRSGKMCH